MTGRVVRVPIDIESQTETLGRNLARNGPIPGVVFLIGELGSGKTTLTRAWLRELGVGGPIKSPTYTLIEPYEVGTLKLFHMDFYRVGAPMELEDIGIRDYFTDDSAVWIEWPERGQALLPPPDLTIELSVGTERVAFLQAHSRQFEELLSGDWGSRY